MPAGAGVQAWGLQMLWLGVGPPVASWCVAGVAGQSDRMKRGQLLTFSSPFPAKET